MANARYEEMNTLLKQWNKNKEQDINIIRGLYSQSNLEKNKLVDRTEDLKNGTQFSNLTTEQFAALFKTNPFNNFDKKELKHLFQELHNRYIGEKGYEITRNVAVVDDKSTTAYGYVCANDDLMFINKNAIDKAKQVEPDKNNFNKTNLGISLLYVLLHESQHVAQFEGSIDNALGRKQDVETAFVAAMTTIENTNFAICDSKQDYSWAYGWKMHYDYQFIEHNANYSAFKKVREMIPEKERKGKAFDQYDIFTTRLSLRDSNSDSPNFVERRIAAMERFTKSEIEYFNKETKDCPMKTQIMDLVNKFMAVDENGNSMFRDKLKREIGEMVEVSKKAKANLGNVDIKTGKKSHTILEQGVEDIPQL